VVAIRKARISLAIPKKDGSATFHKCHIILNIKCELRKPLSVLGGDRSDLATMRLCFTVNRHPGSSLHLVRIGQA
jgi:hypothetical protein